MISRKDRHNSLAGVLASLTAIVIGSLALCSTAAASGQFYVFNEANLTTGNAPTSVVTADFNGDGIPDLAVASPSTQTVDIFLGKTGGTYNLTPDFTYSVGNSPNALAVGKFHGSTNPIDIIVLNSACSATPCSAAGGVYVLTGLGNGQFTETGVEFNVGYNPQDLVVGDFNGDGKLDVATADTCGADSTCASPGTVSVLLGTGSGTFLAAKTTTVLNNPVSLAAADFNGDSKLDLVVAHNLAASPNVVVLMGNGDGTFQPPAEYDGGPNAISVAAGDFNGDGFPDFAVANNSAATVSVLLNNGLGGPGTFPSSPQSVPVEFNARALIVQDMNNDGAPDLVVSENNETFSVLINAADGSGTFLPHEDYLSNKVSNSMVATDINGDGLEDLAFANFGGNSVTLILANGPGAFPRPLATSTESITPVGAVSADFNGDGKLDLAVLNYCGDDPACLSGGTVSILEGNGNGTFNPLPNPISTVGHLPLAIAEADFNKDGKADLVVANSGENTITVLLGNGDGTFQAPLGPFALPCPSAPCHGAKYIAVGDFNGDGAPDIAVVERDSNSVVIMLNKNDGSGKLNPGTSFAVGTRPTWVATGDFNGDGKLDLAVANSTCALGTPPPCPGTVTVLLGNGSGGFTQATGSPIAVGDIPTAVAAGDFNNDTKLDLVVTNFADESFSFLAGNGDGTFQPATNFPVGPAPISIATADLNGDGNLDFITSESSTTFDDVTVVLGNGNGTFQLDLDHAVDFTPPAVSIGEPVLVGEFDCDGTPTCDKSIDVAVVPSGTNTAYAYLEGVGQLKITPPPSFGSVQVGASSAAQTLTITNNGTASTTITSVTLAGADPGDYSVSLDSCTGVELGAGLSCTVDYIFTPTNAGTRSATAIVNGNSFVLLTGTGLAPEVKLSISSLLFNDQFINTTSSAQTVTLTNSGNQTLTISNLTIIGDYAIASGGTCPTSGTVTAGLKCTVNITFTPTQVGLRAGTLTFTDNANNGTGVQQVVSLSGTGTAPAVSLSAPSLTFTSQLVGTTSSVQTVTLTNTGTAALTISSIVASGDFAQNNSCGSSLAASSACTINVTFTPTATGSRSGSVTITDNNNGVSGGTQTVTMTGTGTAPVVSLSASSLTFTNQLVGTTSGAQIITLNNTGSAALTISGIVASGDFAQTNTCGASVAAAGSCTINVTFTPTTSGTRSGSVTITDNNNAVSGSTQFISLTGTGIIPIVSLSAPTLTFSSQLVGTASGAQALTLSNTGTAALTISSIVASGDFAQTNTCGTSVAAAGSCTINVTFTPTAPGVRSGSVTITDNNNATSNSVQTVGLTGTGFTLSAGLSVTSLSFGSQAVGTTSAAQSVTVSNTGTASLNFTAIAASGDFAVDASGTTCSTASPLAASASCAIAITFTPSVTGSDTGTLTLTDNAGTQQVALSGTGTEAGASLTPSSLTFGSQVVGSTSTAQTATLTNTGTSSLTVSGIAATGDFAQTNTCGTLPATIDAGASCAINVTFTPTATGTRTGAVVVTDDASGGQQTLALTGSGTAPGVTLAPSSLTFTSQTVATTSAGQAVTLTNTGSSTVTISAITPNGDFSETNTCGASVAAGANCTISVTFTPTAVGIRTGMVLIADSAAGSPQSIALTGTGVAAAPAAAVSPSSLTFGPQALDTATAAQAVTLSNTGSASLSITSIGITGTNSGDFAQTNTCGASVAAGSSCTISVTYAPSVAGGESATLSVADNASGSPQTVALSGTGTGFSVSGPSGKTITAGQTATWSLVFTPAGGFNGTINLTCAGAPAGSTCTASPASFTLSGTTAVTSTISVTTTAVTLAPPAPTAKPRLPLSFQVHWNLRWLALCLMAFMMFTLLGTFVSRFRQPQWMGVAATTMLVLTWAACGGGGGSAPSSGPPPAPSAALSASSLVFASQNQGTTSAAQNVTLSNPGNATLSISSVSVTGANAGDFAQTNTCGSSVAAGANCSITIKFTPTATGSRAAAININDNATGSPQTINMTGTGVPQATPANTYMLTVTAASSTQTQTIPLTLTVQ